jgi:hypothetical protein
MTYPETVATPSRLASPNASRYHPVNDQGALATTTKRKKRTVHHIKAIYILAGVDIGSVHEILVVIAT